MNIDLILENHAKWLAGDPDGIRADFHKKDISGMTTMEKHVLIGLPYGMGDDLVTHHATIHVKILHIGLAA